MSEHVGRRLHEAAQRASAAAGAVTDGAPAA